jgi:hypothetical protein
MKAFDEVYRTPIVSTAVQQIVALVLAAMFLDGGRTLWGVITAVAGYWGGAVIILCRRPYSPSTGDVNYISLGFIPIVIGAVAFEAWLRSFF